MSNSQEPDPQDVQPTSSHQSPELRNSGTSSHSAAHSDNEVAHAPRSMAEAAEVTGTGTVVMPPAEAEADPPSTDAEKLSKNSVFARTMQAEVPDGTGDAQTEPVISEIVHSTAVVSMEDLGDAQNADAADGSGHVGSLNTHRTPQVETDDASSDYELLSRIGEGGMGAIYLARQTALNREVAIKTLKPLTPEERAARGSTEKANEAEQQRLEMFLSEALVTANLVHPHIVPIHDLSRQDPSSPFYVMKRVKGTPWHERVHEMSLADNLEVLLKVCDAVAYAHHRGVVNRDLKPENVMLGEFGEVLVLDWGLAAPTGSSHQIQFKSLSASYGAGTPAYMAPELWNGPREKIGPWSDVYLLGATLFEIITGYPPHQFPEPPAGTSGTALWSIIDRVVRVNQIRATDVRGELFDIATKAMSTDPAERYGSVVEFQQAIRDYQQHQESLYLSDRADELLTSERRVSERGEGESEWTGPERRSGKDRRESYRDYQAATTLYEEAWKAWPENEAARTGLRKARLDYATLALTKGDYDLGLQIAALETGTDFDSLKNRLRRARAFRQGLRSGAMVAVAAIILLGIFSTAQAIRISRQKDAIEALAGTRESLTRDNEKLQLAREQAQSDREAAVAEREEAVELAEAARQEQLLAEQQRAAAIAEQQAAETARAEAEAERRRVEKERDLAARALKDAERARSAAIAAQMKAEAEKLAARKETVIAGRQKAEAERSLQKIAADLKQLDAEKARAEVELRNTQIGSLVRNADYSAAVQRIEQLLTALQNDPTLQKLPDEERQQREVELEARLRQLQRRTLRTDAPVQTQLIDLDRNRMIWGGADGTLTIRSIPGSGDDAESEVLQSAKVRSAITRLAWSTDRRKVYVATGSEVLTWTLRTNDLKRLINHESSVTAMVVLDDLLLSADEAGDIRATFTDGEQQAKTAWVIRGTAGIRDLALLPNAKILLTAGSKGGQSADVAAWQFSDEVNQRPQRMGQLRFPRWQVDPPLRLAVSPDESTLVISNARNGGLWVLPRQTKAESESFPFQHASDAPDRFRIAEEGRHHLRPVNDLQFSADGRRLVTASDDRTALVWQVEAPNAVDAEKNASTSSLKLQRRLQGHGARVLSAAFMDREGRFVSSSGADRLVRLWDVARDHEQQQQIEDAFQLAQSATRPVSPAIQSSFSDSEDHQSRYLRTGHPAEQNEYEESIELNVDGLQRGAIRALAFADDGNMLATGAGDGSTVLWNTTTGLPLRRSINSEQPVLFRDGHDYNISSLQFLPPFGAIALTTGYDGTMCVWDADLNGDHPGRQVARVDGLGLVNAVSAAPDGQTIATTWAGDHGHGRDVALWKLSELLAASEPAPARFLRDYHREPVSAVAFSPNGKRVGTAGRDGCVAVWDAETGRLLASGQMHTSRTLVKKLTWLTDQSLISAGYDGRLLQLHWTANESAESNDTGHKAEPAMLRVALSYEHEAMPVEQLIVSPDRQRFLSLTDRAATSDAAIDQNATIARLWRVGRAAAEARIRPADIRDSNDAFSSPGPIHSAAWSDDGQHILLAAGSTVQLIDAKSRQVTKVMRPDSAELTGVTFRSNRTAKQSDLLAGTFHQRSARLWNLSRGTHIASLHPPASVLCLTLTGSHSTRLLTGGRSLRLFEAGHENGQAGRCLAKIFQPHATPIGRLAAAPDGSSFVTGGLDGQLRFWQHDESATGIEAKQSINIDGHLPIHLSYSRSGQVLQCVSPDGTIRLLRPERDVVDAEWRSRLPGVEVLCADFDETQQFVVLAGQHRQTQESIAHVFRREANRLQLHCVIQGHEAGGITGVAFLPNSDHLVTAGTDGRVLIWNWQPGRQSPDPFQAYEAYEFLTETQPRAHRSPVTAMTVSKSNLIATASADGAATIWRNPFSASREKQN